MRRSTEFLSGFCAEKRLDKNYLILPSYQIGHQIGEALTGEGGPWVNLHFVHALRCRHWRRKSLEHIIAGSKS